jgi:hypothetical protein
MSLRKPPCPTPASLAARRGNARKSTGPRTGRGKARVALNALKHGRRAVALQDKLVRAGCRDGEAIYRRIRSRLLKTFAMPGDHSDRHADRLTNWIWVSQREWRRRESTRTKLECALKSGTGTVRLTKRTRIVTNNYPMITPFRRGQTPKSASTTITGGLASYFTLSGGGTGPISGIKWRCRGWNVFTFPTVWSAVACYRLVQASLLAVSRTASHSGDAAADGTSRASGKREVTL